MSVSIKSAHEIELMRESCRRLSIVHKELEEAIRPGISTLDIDRLGEKLIRSLGGIPNFLHYNGYPASICVSVNDEVVHGIPSKHRILQEGDIVSLDAGLIYKGFHSDAARTHAVGKVSPEAQKLMDATRESLFLAIEKAVPGNRIGDIGSAVQQYVEARNYSVVREFVGHGVGAKLHEDPSVPNYGTPGRGVRLLPGMTIAIEPMVTQGSCEVKILKDGWTTVTKDGKLAAHFEHSIAITPDGPVILTSLD